MKVFTIKTANVFCQYNGWLKQEKFYIFGICFFTENSYHQLNPNRND